MARRERLQVAWVSLGCPKNLVDSEQMLGRLAEAGCVVGAPMDRADVIVVNTCGFLQAARAESLEAISEALAQKRRGRARRVVVAGCLVECEAERLYQLAPGIDAIVGVHSRGEIAAAVMSSERVTKIAPFAGGVSCDAGRFRLTRPHSAYLRIAEGCSQRCSFCTIPAIRGPFRSKPPRAVLAEAEELIDAGAVELNVIAQDTTSYGRDLPVPLDLAGLLGRLGRLDGLRWLRLLYAYPLRFSDELIDAIAGTGRVVPYVDLPLQHVSDTILRRMQRGVRRKGIERLVDRLRDRIDGLVLRTTMMVGFPGESDAEFQELLDFVREIRFDALGVFEFSAEPGTPAAELPGQVPDPIKAERARTLMLAQQEIAFAANRRRIGSAVEVLVDGVDDRGRCFGRTCGQAPDIDGICYLTEAHPAGTFVPGKVVDTRDYDLIVAAQP